MFHWRKLSHQQLELLAQRPVGKYFIVTMSCNLLLLLLNGMIDYHLFHNRHWLTLFQSPLSLTLLLGGFLSLLLLNLIYGIKFLRSYHAQEELVLREGEFYEN